MCTGIKCVTLLKQMRCIEQMKLLNLCWAFHWVTRSTQTSGVSSPAAWSRCCCSASAALPASPDRPASQWGDKPACMYPPLIPPPFTTPRPPLPHCGKLLVDAVSEHLHGTVSETISSKNPKKSGRKNFTLAGDPNTKSLPPPPLSTIPPTVCEYRWQTAWIAAGGSAAPLSGPLSLSFCLSCLQCRVKAHWGSQVYVTHLDTWGRWLPMGSASPSAPLTDKMTLTDWLTQSVDGPWHAGHPLSRLCPRFSLCSSSSAVLGRNELRVRSFQNVIEK